MEFKEFVKGFNRMEEYYRTNGAEVNPFENATESEYIDDWAMWSVNHPDKAERFVESWVERHPEPIYPTFLDIVNELIGNHTELRGINISDLMHLRVPEDTAAAFGITPIQSEKYIRSDWQ